jgi:hypothetical protein
MTDIETEKLHKFGIKLDNYKEYQVLCLPENVESAVTIDKLYDASDTANLSKKLKASGIKCGNSYDLGIEVGVLERRAADLWLGAIWIINNIAIPSFVNVFCNILTPMIQDRFRSAFSVIKKPDPQIHLSLKVLRGENYTDIKYDGDPETLKQLLNGIRIGIENKK